MFYDLLIETQHMISFYNTVTSSHISIEMHTYVHSKGCITYTSILQCSCKEMRKKVCNKSLTHQEDDTGFEKV